MLPDYEPDPSRFTRNAFSTAIKDDSVTRVKDYQGNVMMSGVDFRTTSLHDKRGVTLKAQKARDAARSNFLPVHM